MKNVVQIPNRLVDIWKALFSYIFMVKSIKTQYSSMGQIFKRAQYQQLPFFIAQMGLKSITINLKTTLVKIFQRAQHHGVHVEVLAFFRMVQWARSLLLVLWTITVEYFRSYIKAYTITCRNGTNQIPLSKHPELQKMDQNFVAWDMLYHIMLYL